MTSEPATDFPEDAVHGIERTTRTGMPGHITAENTDRALALLEHVLDTELVVIDCSEITSDKSLGHIVVDAVVDEFENELFSEDYKNSLDQSRQHRWWAFEDGLAALEEHNTNSPVVVFHNFGDIPESEHAFTAQKLKALLETTDTQFFVTSVESGIVTAANPDLRGRIRGIPLK